jgi:uncharacterized membrane protein SirB2
MRTKVLHVLTACLTLVAALNVIGFAVFMVLWVTIGDTHDAIWAASKYPVIALAIVIPVIYLVLDWRKGTTSRSRAIRFWLPLVVTLFALTQKVRSETSRIKGWSPEQAALNVASSLYPGSAHSFTLQQLNKEELSVMGRGPSITYLVMDEGQPACKVGVCRRYSLWWTCGMYETLKERNTAQQGAAPLPPASQTGPLEGAR